jgi:hypothetical protein
MFRVVRTIEKYSFELMMSWRGCVMLMMIVMLKFSVLVMPAVKMMFTEKVLMVVNENVLKDIKKQLIITFYV